MDIQSRIDKLKHSKEELISYMQVKIDIEDWHAVSDAANDLREIDVELITLNEIERHVIDSFKSFTEGV